MTDDRQGPARPLLYLFPHVALRDAVFENHPELTRELAEGPDALPLLHFRSRARLLRERAGLGGDAALDTEEALLDAVRLRTHRRGGHTVHVVTMPAPEHPTEVHFAAIVHRDGEPREYMRASPSTQYFTLEMADAGEPPLLCEWQRDERHVNYGAGPEADADAFAETVLGRVEARP